MPERPTTVELAELRELADMVEHTDLDAVIAALDMPSQQALDICARIADLARGARAAVLLAEDAARLRERVVELTTERDQWQERAAEEARKVLRLTQQTGAAPDAT